MLSVEFLCGLLCTAYNNNGQLTPINAEFYASMNMWGLTPEFMQTLEDG